MDQIELLEYLKTCRKEYIKICGLGEDRVISDMQSGRVYLKTQLGKFLKERKCLESDKNSDLVKKTLELFKLKEGDGVEIL